MTELALLTGFIGIIALCRLEKEIADEYEEDVIPLWLSHISGPYTGKNNIKLRKH